MHHCAALVSPIYPVPTFKPIHHDYFTLHLHDYSFFQYSFHWRLLESVVPFVELNCQFLLLNDMFDMRAINYLLTYLQCWCRNFQVARLSTIPLANGETCSAEVTGLFPGGDIDSKHWYQLSVL